MNRVYHNAFFAMNTRCNVVFPDVNQNIADRVFHDLKLETVRIESKLSRFLPDSQLSKINKQAFDKPVQLDKELFEILTTCKRYYDITDGAFDVTLRPLMNYWNEESEERKYNLEFDELRNQLGMDHIDIDEYERTISFDNENIEIDLGGFGKGYTLKKMERLIRYNEIENAFITFGESSVLTLGHHPAGDYWKVSINNYQNPGNSIHEFAINDGSISTSANFYLADNGKLHNHRHVIDPFKGVPVEDCITVTVYDRSPLVAEMLSTAFLVSSDKLIQQTLEKMDDTRAVKVDYSDTYPQVQRYINNNNNNLDIAAAWE